MIDVANAICPKVRFCFSHCLIFASRWQLHAFQFLDSGKCLWNLMTRNILTLPLILTVNTLKSNMWEEESEKNWHIFSTREIKMAFFLEDMKANNKMGLFSVQYLWNKMFSWLVSCLMFLLQIYFIVTSKMRVSQIFRSGNNMRK